MVGFITAYTKPRVCNASANLDSGGWSNCCSYVGIIGSIASRQFGFDYCMLRSRYRWDISSAQCNTQCQNRGAVETGLNVRKTRLRFTTLVSNLYSWPVLTGSDFILLH